MTTAKEIFLNSTRSIDEYKATVNAETTPAEHSRWLQETVAQTTEGYIVRRKRGSGYYYKEIPELTLRKILNFTITVSETKGDKSVVRKWKIVDLLTDLNARPELATYNGMDMITSDPFKLSRYVPPIGPENNEWAKSWLDYLRTRVNNVRSFDEEISSHAYRLRYPDSFIEKCFVHYSRKGNTGKSTLAWTLGLLYPTLANVSVAHSQLTEKINGWTTDYLMIHVEELQGTEYLNKDFAAWIKRATMRKASIRKMYSDTTDGENWAIIGLNTNQTDLYGLATTNDEALQSRLVVLDFKEDGMNGTSWAAKYKEFNIDNTRPDFSQQIEKFAAALYHYLRFEYKIVDGFTPNRYDQPDKREVLAKLRKQSGTFPDVFLNSLEKMDLGYDMYQPFKAIQMMKRKNGKSDDPKKVIITLAHLKNAWRAFMQDKTGAQANYSLEKSVFPLLFNLGFSERKISVGKAFICEDVQRFEEWYSKRAAPEPDTNLDDYVLDVDEDDIEMQID